MPVLGGFILQDTDTGEYGIGFRRDWSGLCDPEDAEILGGMEDQLKAMAIDGPPGSLIDFLEPLLSNLVRSIDRNQLPPGVGIKERQALLSAAFLGQ